MTESEARAMIEQRGLRLDRRGRAWRITGTGIDLLLADLRHLHATDVRPTTRPAAQPGLPREHHERSTRWES